MNPALAHPFYIGLKASLAALLALAAVELLAIPDRLSATFVAVACISPTAYTGLRRGLDQIGASAIGGLVTLGLSRLLPGPAALGLALFAAIYVSFRVGMARGFLVAAFTVLYVQLIPGLTPGLVLEYRLASVAIGVASAIAMNVAISLVSYRSVFSRRLGIARAALASQWTGLADLMARERRPESARAALFEEVFPLLRALMDELSDAEREIRWRGGRPRASIEAARRAAEELLVLAHHGKDLALALDRTGAAFPACSARAAALGAAIRADAPVPFDASPVEAELRQALESAIAAWERARSAAASF